MAQHLRFSLAIFLVLLLAITSASSISRKLLCLDIECKGVISQARVAKTIKQQIGELPVVTSGHIVNVFAKNTDSSSSHWGIEYQGMYGFVDSSFLKEIGKGKNVDLIFVNTPARFEKNISPEKKAQKEAEVTNDDTEDDTEATVEEVSINKSNYDDTISNIPHRKNGAPVIPTSKSTEKDETEDEEESVHASSKSEVKQGLGDSLNQQEKPSTSPIATDQVKEDTSKLTNQKENNKKPSKSHDVLHEQKINIENPVDLNKQKPTEPSKQQIPNPQLQNKINSQQEDPVNKNKHHIHQSNTDEINSSKHKTNEPISTNQNTAKSSDSGVKSQEPLSIEPNFAKTDKLNNKPPEMKPIDGPNIAKIDSSIVKPHDPKLASSTSAKNDGSGDEPQHPALTGLTAAKTDVSKPTSTGPNIAISDQLNNKREETQESSIHAAKNDYSEVKPQDPTLTSPKMTKTGDLETKADQLISTESNMANTGSSRIKPRDPALPEPNLPETGLPSSDLSTSQNKDLHGDSDKSVNEIDSKKIEPPLESKLFESKVQTTHEKDMSNEKQGDDLNKGHIQDPSEKNKLLELEDPITDGKHVSTKKHDGDLSRDLFQGDTKELVSDKKQHTIESPQETTVNHSDASVVPSSKESVNDSKIRDNSSSIPGKINLSVSISEMTDPWTGSGSVSNQHGECISFFTERSLLLRMLKRFFDVSIIPVRQSIKLMPTQVVSSLSAGLPYYIGLSLEAVILGCFFFFTILIWSAMFKCCLCRRNYTKELNINRDLMMSLEEKLVEKDKANSEIADWNSRLVRQVKDYENQVVFLKSDTSTQVKDLTKELEELSSRYDETLREIEILRERSAASEEAQLLARKELELQLATEIDRMANTITENDQTLALKQVEAERQANMVIEISHEREQLVSQMNAYYDQMVLMKKEAEKMEENRITLEETVQMRHSELNAMRESFSQLKAFDIIIEEIESKHLSEDEDQKVNNSENGEEEELENKDELNKNKKLDAIREKVLEFLDTNKLRFERNEAVERIAHLENRLREETSARDEVEYRLSELEKEKIDLSSGQQEAEAHRIDAQKKLDILSQYFKERESEMQRSMGEQEVRKSHSNQQYESQVSRSKILEEEMNAMREQLVGMRKELEDSERAYRRQTVELERRAHENWLAARASERELKEMKEGSLSLRQKLLESEKSRQMPPIPFPMPGGFPRPPANSPPPILPPGMYPPQMGRPGSRHSSSDKDRPPSRTSTAAPPMPRMPFMPPPPPGLRGMPPLPPPPPFGMFLPPPMMSFPRPPSMPSNMNNMSQSTNNDSFQSQ